MITLLAILGVVCLTIGLIFAWFNLYTPIQTCIPIVAVPAGIIYLCLAIGGALL